ncbi:ABC transporter ATP-binding protein [Hydrogenovibrio sp. SC-1]|uniref:ABC-F family ATP-binding cassette domain-containing protein n=1 Tax=Hydrogenovibrio sp. SC-1 TaxID=2065820 RepID=UPI000C798FAA|nr:ATP-binding cassette domain-containing protein [Hydrogenovibrio sp. SC-1]PLA74484.1 ABC transporter ATP-binding protein [Hydrogenovibrio sp. SC-1]
MTTLIHFEHLGFQHPNGQVLFDNLNGKIGHETLGLVGDNGVGKTTLSCILAGELSPSNGHIQRQGSIYYLPQQIRPQKGDTLADLMAIAPILSALDRIEQGSIAESDFEIVGAHWDIHRQIQIQLQQYDLAHLELSTPCEHLSGGEMTRVALIGAFLSDADLLILDEPTNHLDIQQRQILFQQIRDWKGGILVVSHDVQLLQEMDGILELSALGLNRYGGNYDFYQQQKLSEQQALQANLDHAKQQRKVELKALQRQQERQQKKQASGQRENKFANQAKSLLDCQKERSQHTSAKLNRHISDTRQQLNQNVQQAAQALPKETPRYLFAPQTQVTDNKMMVTLHKLVMPFGLMNGEPFNLEIIGPKRLALIGPNGCGKSTLLKLIAGQIAADSGDRHCFVSCAYIDQHANPLQPEKDVLEQLRQSSGFSESDARQRLALIGLSADKVTLPSCQLSGGERMKAALLCVLYRRTPVQLLLLDEPNNHIDLSSSQALVEMLNQYQGALIIVSHDIAFLSQLQLTHSLKWQTKQQVPTWQAW